MSRPHARSPARSSSRSSARKSRRGERFGCETRSVRCEDFFFKGRAHHTALLAPRVGPRTRWDPPKMSLEARVIHLGPPPGELSPMCRFPTSVRVGTVYMCMCMCTLTHTQSSHRYSASASLPAHHNAHNFALRMQRFSHVTITRFKSTVRPVSAVSRTCGRRDSHHSQHAPSSHTSKLHAHFTTITHIAHRVIRPSSSAASLLK